MEREDGEMSDDNSMIIDDMDVDDPFQATHDDCTMVDINLVNLYKCQYKIGNNCIIISSSLDA